MAGAQSFVFRFTGTQKMHQWLQECGTLGPVILAASLREEAEEFIADVKENHIPRDNSALAGSGYVRPVVLTQAYARVVFGFGGPAAPYAWVIHENPRAGKTGGISPSGHKYKTWAQVGGWKYLEVPMLAWEKTVGSAVGKRIRTFWLSVIKKAK